MIEQRRVMSLDLHPQAGAGAFADRTVTPEDAAALGILLYQSFRGSIDDEGETVDDAIREIAELYSGAYGRFLPEASFVIEDEDRLCSACLVTWFEHHAAPLVAFSMTSPEARRRGMARQLLQRSIDALLQMGETRLTLVVTPGNAPGLELYRSLGFVDWLDRSA